MSTPAQLLASAAGFLALTPRRHLVSQAYLLSQNAAMNFTATVNAAAPLSVLSKRELKCAMVGVLANLAGKDYLATEAGAAAWQGFSQDELTAVQTSALAGAVGVTLTSLLMQSVGFDRLSDRDLYLSILSMEGAGLTLKQILALAPPFYRFSDRGLEEAITYLLSLGIIGQGSNIIPAGAGYAGGLAEFDIAISANTTYQITWGANDVSATVCGNNFLSTGTGTTTTFASAGCTLLQLFGNSAGTTVTAVVNKVPANNIGTVSNFAWTSNGPGTQLTASWNYIIRVDFYELWTSTDGVIYALNQTINTPGVSAGTAVITAPAKGTVIYGKVRVSWNGNYGSFNAPVIYAGQTADWVKRINLGGGITPSAATQLATSTFVNTLITKSLESKIGYLLPFAPDSLIAATTPLYNTNGGNSPATNHSFVAGDLSASGMLGDGVNKYLDTGVMGGGVGWPWSIGGSSATPLGLSIYCMTATAAGMAPLGAINGTGGSGNALLLNIFFPVCGVSFEDQDFNGIIGGGVANNTTGFISLNRLDAAHTSIYRANSAIGFTTVATFATTGGSPNGSLPIYAYASNNGGATSPSAVKLSFAAIHAGLTSGQSQDLFNAVQAFRTALGGGFV